MKKRMAELDAKIKKALDKIKEKEKKARLKKS
jgi:hypothetical protein